MLRRVADWCYRRRGLVVICWMLVLLGSIALAGAFAGTITPNYLPPGTDSKAASQTLKRTFPQKAGSSLQIVVQADAGVTAPQVRARVERILNDVAREPHVVAVTNPFSTSGSGQISRDGRTAYAEADLAQPVEEFDATEAKELINPILRAGDGALQVEVGGEVAALAQSPAFGAEGIGFLAAAIILLVSFGSVVAMSLPLLNALFGLGVALSLGQVLGRFVAVADWTPAVAAMIGIGVGIDYALLVVTRYRSSLAQGEEPRRAVSTAIATAGRSVIFAGMVVVVSVLGMFVMNQPFVPGFALLTGLVVLIIMATSVTLLPAVLGFAGHNIERLRVPFLRRSARPDDASLWHRWGRKIQRRPWPAALVSLGVLLALAAPFLGIRFGFPDAQNDRPGSTTRRAYDLLSEGFGPGFSAPILLVAQGGSGSRLLSLADAVGDQLRSVSGVASVAPAVANPAGDTAVLTVVSTTSPQDARTEELLDRLRRQSIPAATAGTGLRITIGGLVAVNSDISRSVSARLPLFIGGVVLTSFLLLLTVFRSILVPLKAAVMNLLSIGAAYGVLALATGGGVVGQLFGIPGRTPVPILMPVMMFALLFGLSMDYEVFLLSRIKEEYDRTRDNSQAVAAGLAKTGRVITAAAAIMVTVFVSFVPGGDVLQKMFGIGLATAILVDATLVRMVLVPATMELLGDRNWWLPGWLDRAVPRLQLEPTGEPPPASAGPFRTDPAIHSASSPVGR